MGYRYRNVPAPNIVNFPLEQKNIVLYKMLYFDSLESHMKKYMDDIMSTEMNDSLQSQKIKLLRQIDLSSISQAEAANKLEELKKIAIALKSNENIPFNKTSAPEQVKQAKQAEEVVDTYNPMTVQKYERAIKNKMTLDNKIPIYGNKSLIDELKEKLQKRDQAIVNTEGIRNKGKISNSANMIRSEGNKAGTIISSTAATTSSASDIANLKDVSTKLNFKQERKKNVEQLMQDGYSKKDAENKLRSARTIAELNKIMSGGGLILKGKYHYKRIL
jgi:uncharacterized protein YbaA (DUF1428 family)